MFPLFGRVLVIFLAFLGISAGQETEEQVFEKWLRQNREVFPEIKLGRDKIPFARVHSMPAVESKTEYRDRYFTGYRFTAPEWLDGDVIWMFGMPGDMTARATFKWYIVPEEPTEERAKLWMYRQGSQHYPRFRELFPGCGSMIQQSFSRPFLKPGARYIVWFSFPTPQTHELRYSLTVDSERGLAELGMLPSGYPDQGPNKNFRKSTDLKEIPPAELLGAAKKILAAKGIEPALAELDRGLRHNVDAGASFLDFWLAAWREAQVGSGRTEREWAAALNLWLQQRCLDYDATDLAVGLGSNGASTLMDVYRYGSARSTLIPFYSQMERRKVDLDPLSYPDAGPAFPSFPEVRMREFSLEGNQPASLVSPSGLIRYRTEMPSAFSACMLNLASLEMMGGSWRQAIERSLWVRHWAEVKRKEVHEPENSWYQSQLKIASVFNQLGLLELANDQYKAVLDHDWPDPYHGRSKLAARAHRIKVAIRLGKADPAMLAELDEIYEASKKNVFLHNRSWEEVETIKAECLDRLGRKDEADAILTRLTQAENHPARVMRIQNRIRAGSTEGVENELLAVLALTREWGRKVDEAELYSLYADFLTNTGRLPEALAMRRESIRLMRSFDLFVHLPGELANLSVLLSKCGEKSAADAAAEEATRLSQEKGRVPARVSSAVGEVLKKRVSAGVPAAANDLFADLQPINASLIPIAGMPLRGRLTLSNPSSTAVEGSLTFSGLPVDATWKQPTGEASATLGKTGTNVLRNVRVDAGSFAVIDLAAAPDSLMSGELKVIWSAPARKDQVSVWTIEKPDSGVAAAVVDAGVFKRNAFYGVPVHHHYQSPVAEDGSVPIRAVCSIPARVELYDAENRPVYVDANGNGEFGDPGDVVHQDADRDGSPDIQLRSGETRMRLQVFPSGDLPSDGLKIALESRFQGKWTPFAEDILQP